MWSPSEGEQLRALFRCAIANFPPQDQQHAIAFDLLCNLLNLLAATSTTPSTTPAKPSSQRTAVAIDDMDDDDLFFHILQQELTSVNRHFEESAGAILAQWAAHTRDASSRSTSTSSTPDRDRGLTASFDSSQSETWSATEDVCLHQQKARQAAKWCWQFACINSIAARCLVEKRDDIRRDGAGVLFLETQLRRCRFMQSPLPLELQAIAALQHATSDGHSPSVARGPTPSTPRTAGKGSHRAPVMKGSPPSSPSGASTSSSLSHAVHAAHDPSAGDCEAEAVALRRSGSLPPAVLSPFLCQPTCKTIPTQCQHCQAVLSAAIGLACGCVLCDTCAVRQLVDDAPCLQPAPVLRGMRRLKSLATGQRKKVTTWLSMEPEENSLDDAVRKHVQQSLALQACPCCDAPGSFRESMPLPALATVAARTHPDHAAWTSPPADLPAWLHDVVYEVAFAGLPMGGCGDTQRGGRGPGTPRALRKAVEQPGFVRARAMRRWRGEAPSGWVAPEAAG